MKHYRWYLVVSLVCLFAVNPAYAETYTASTTPWSGYWWPFTNGGLATGNDYRGHPAPLEKYELLTLGRYPGNLVSWYRGQYYNPNAPAWYGLCAYWARSACYEPGNIFPSSENNIIFRVGDKKGLLTLAHDNDLLDIDDGYKPEIFHYWLLHFIKDQGVSFAADLDSGEQVWTYPIFAFDMQTTQSGNTKTVNLKIHYSDDHVHPDYQGSLVKSKSYLYDLFLDESGAVIGGEWKESSVFEHPDVLSLPLLARHKSDYLDYEEVTRLAQAGDDFLENGSQPVTLPPGTYNLVLLDEDRYLIDCLPGDVISLTVEKQDGSSLDPAVVLVDSIGMEVLNTVVTESTPLSQVMTVGMSPYLLIVNQSDYTDPNIYTVKLDLDKACSRQVPYIPNSSMWSGFAVTNLGSTPATRVMLTSYSSDGTPVQTLFGPATMAPGQKQVFQFKNLPWRRHERSSHNNVMVMSDTPVAVTNLFGPSNLVSVSGFVPREETLPYLIVPDTVEPLSMGTTMVGGIENSSFEAIQIMARVYTSAGALQKTFLEWIDPRAMLSINPDSSPFSPLPASGWIEIIGHPEQNPQLTGYQHLSSSGKTESLFALRADSAETFVPHVPPPGYWITRLTVINPHDAANQVNLHLARAGSNHAQDMNVTLDPREKRVIELQSQFGLMPDSPYYHSVLRMTGQDSVAGYFTYSTPADEASMPLMDAANLKKQLALPHSPATSGMWWVGIGIINPSQSAVTVRAEPYDQQGALIANSVKTFSIGPGAYEAVTTTKLFGSETAAKISFVTFTAVEQQGVIGGFYLYGTSGNVMLTGAVMDGE